MPGRPISRTQDFGPCNARANRAQAILAVGVIVTRQVLNLQSKVRYLHGQCINDPIDYWLSHQIFDLGNRDRYPVGPFFFGSAEPWRVHQVVTLTHYC